MCDFQAIFSCLASDLHTVEGNVAGSRAASLERKRAAEQQDEFGGKQGRFGSLAAALTSKFAVQVESNAAFQAAMIGLVTAEQFREIQQGKTSSSITDEQNKETQEDLKKKEKANRKARKKKLREKKKQLATLSFAVDDVDEVEEATAAPAVTSSKKDPTIDTSFLPDATRDRMEQEERMRLQELWKEQQEAVKQETLEYRSCFQCLRKSADKGQSLFGHALCVINKQNGSNFSHDKQE